MSAASSASTRYISAPNAASAAAVRAATAVRAAAVRAAAGAADSSCTIRCYPRRMKT